MKNALRYVLVVLLALVLGAHFLRWGQVGLALTCAVVPVLLAFRRRWCAHVVSLMLLAGAALWSYVTFVYVVQRVRFGSPWLRLTVILGGVAVLCVVGAILLNTARARERFRYGTAWAATAAFVLVFAVCGFLQAWLREPVPLLLERFWPGYGWLQVFALAAYAAVVTDWLVARRSTAAIRSRLWLMFSVVFFAQLIVGLLGVEKLLMTGTLHLPVPALILAGPLYRGEGFFMLILFLSTLLVVGRAWCSWLCYVGAWDHVAASARRPRTKARHYAILRASILVLVLVVAVALRQMGVGGAYATMLAGAFGLVGVGIMAAASRRMGFMVHCTSYCPIGLVTDTVGRINPFRVRIGQQCDECRACTVSCRYAALKIEHIRRRRPGITCTLCGDCLSACEKSQIHYHFPALTGETARTLFLVLVAALHAIFLGVARL